MSKRKSTSESASKPRPTRILVVYGYDEKQKPRAAKFGEPEIALARKAADLMKLNMFETDAPKTRRKLKRLPLGNVYASGWGFVPNVRRTQFDSILKIADAVNPMAPEPVPQTNLPNSWDSIGVGNLVLGQADSAADGWWPVNVVEAVDGDMLRLQARDYPEVAPVIRHRLAVALFYTGDFVPPEQVGVFATGLPISWATLTTGQLVLAAANEKNSETGWWEAEIVKIGGDWLTLKWRDFPRRRQVKRLRTDVALINPVPPQAS